MRQNNSNLPQDDPLGRAAAQSETTTEMWARAAGLFGKPVHSERRQRRSTPDQAQRAIDAAEAKRAKRRERNRALENRIAAPDPADEDDSPSP